MEVPIASAVLVVLLFSRIRGLDRAAPSRFDRSLPFFLLVSLCVLAVRLPRIVWSGELNVDESQMIAQAMRYLAHPVPWRDVDGTTGGPLDSLLLCPVLLLGAGATWPTARIVLWACNCLTLVFLYRALRPFGTRKRCQLALMPAIFFYAFAVNANFAHYSSETLSCLLIAVCLALLSTERQASRPSLVRPLLLGLAAGAIPFAKLQAGPVALFLVAVGSIIIVRRADAARASRPRWTGLAALFAGVLLIPGAILGTVIASGAVRDFWHSYVLASVAYAGQEGVARKLRNLAYLFTAPADFRPFAIGVALLLAVSWLTLRARGSRLEERMRRPLLVVAAQCLLTLICIAIAGKSFLHYALLLVPPLALLAGLGWLAATAPGRDQGGADVAPVTSRPLLAALAVAMALQIVMPALYVRAVVTGVLPRGHAPVSAVAQSILSVREPGDQLSVWGWVPAYYVETGLVPATRDAVGHYVVSPGPYQDYFRNRYLADLEGSRPAFFVDAVATSMFGWGWSEKEAHEGFPALAEFIDRDYRLWKSVRYSPAGTPVRLYLLRARAAKLGLGAALDTTIGRAP